MHKLLKSTLFLLLPAFFVAACAQKPEDIMASYISPTTYQGWNCQQLQAEAVRVDNAISRASAQQLKARSDDTAGVILLGLPVSSLSGGNVAAQIADLKGRKEVIEQTQISSKCVIIKASTLPAGSSK